MSFNPYSDPVARELHNATSELRDIGDQLAELNQPPAVRSTLQAERVERSQARMSAVGLVLGLAAAWVVLSLVFGVAGQRLFGTLLGFAWDALGALIVLGAVVGIAGAVYRLGRAVVAVGRQNHAGTVE